MTAAALQNIPIELRSLRQWVVWKYEQQEGADKPTKVPYDPKSARHASTADAATWGTFETIVAALGSGFWDGAGFVFAENDPFTGVDLDVPEAGQPNEYQRQTLHKLNSYAEFSPSGRGLHIIVKGAVPSGRNNREVGIEVYSSGRFFTVTGNALGEPKPIAERNGLVNELWTEIGGQRDIAIPHSDTSPAKAMPDDELVGCIRESDANRRNYDGQVSDWSDAYFALICAACLFSSDEAQVRRVVMASPLVQDASPKGRETRAHKAERLWAREYRKAALRGAGERQERAMGVDHGRQVAETLLAGWQGQGGTRSRSNLIIRSMAEVTMEAIEYVWPGWVPKGYITLIGGETGSGKTSVVADMTARVSTGAPWPNETEWRAPAKVLWLGSEDGIADMTVPRLNACGANLHNIIEIQGVSREGVRNTFSLQDDIQNVAMLLDEGIAEDRPYTVIVIDPITSYLSSANRREVKMNDAGQMRAVLEPWMDVAQRYGVSIICITHLAKDTNRSMLHRFLGSSAFTHTCRSLIAIVDRKTDDQPWAKAMVQVKTNLPDHPGGAFLFETERVQVGVSETNGKPIHATKPNWEDIDPLVTVDNLVASSGARSERSLGFALWLSQYFRGKPTGEEVEVSKVKEAALEAAIVTAKQWERFSPKYLEKRNLMGIWYCRPIEKVE